MPRKRIKTIIGGKTKTRELSTDDVIRHILELFDLLGLSAEDLASRVKGLKFAKGARRRLPYHAQMGELLTSWHQDLRYLDGAGMPLPIRMSGSEPSFSSLANRSLPGVDPKKLLRELKAVGAISLDRQKRVRVEMRFLSVYLNRKFAIHYTLANLTSFVRTLKHNLLSEPSNADQLFHRVARNASIDLRDLPTMKVRLNRQGQQFLESWDNWMTHRSKSRTRSRGRRAQVAVGIYLAVDDAAVATPRNQSARR